jgi:hypothetical protein
MATAAGDFEFFAARAGGGMSSAEDLFVAGRIRVGGGGLSPIRQDEAGREDQESGDDDEAGDGRATRTRRARSASPPRSPRATTGQDSGRRPSGRRDPRRRFYYARPRCRATGPRRRTGPPPRRQRNYRRVAVLGARRRCRTGRAWFLGAWDSSPGATGLPSPCTPSTPDKYAIEAEGRLEQSSLHFTKNCEVVLPTAIFLGMMSDTKCLLSSTREMKGK